MSLIPCIASISVIMFGSPQGNNRNDWGRGWKVIGSSYSKDIGIIELSDYLPTPVFLPGESQGRGSLVGCRLWSRTESDTTEVT